MSTKSSSLLSTNPRNWATVPLRLGAGGTLFAHGAQKLFGWFGGYGLHGTAGFFANVVHLHPGIFWAVLVGCGEFFGGLLLVFGLGTRYAAITTTIIMAVAMWVLRHGGFFAPMGIELPLAVFVSCVSLLISGGGALSVDAGRSRPSAG